MLQSVPVAPAATSALNVTSISGGGETLPAAPSAGSMAPLVNQLSGSAVVTPPRVNDDEPATGVRPAGSASVRSVVGAAAAPLFTSFTVYVTASPAAAVVTFDALVDVDRSGATTSMFSIVQPRRKYSPFEGE